MKYKPVKVAIVGCGVISSIYIESIQKNFSILDIKACADLDVERMNACARQFNILPMTFDEILADDEIEMIINLTNPIAHYTINKQALEQGKHVFSEKMIAVDLKDGAELCEIAQRENLYLGVAPDTFLGAALQTSRYIIDSGLIGKPLSFVASLNRDYGLCAELLPHLRKKGGGIAFDMGVYYITALCSLLGNVQAVTAFSQLHQPDRVEHRMGSATFGEEYKIETENVVVASLQYQSGVVGTLHMNSDSIIEETTRLEIYGTEGILYAGDPNCFNSKVYLKKISGEIFEFPYTHGYSEQSRGVGAAEMAWAIRENREHRTSKEMAYHVFETLHALLQSSNNSCVMPISSTFVKPKALPSGYIANELWQVREESALVGG